MRVMLDTNILISIVIFNSIKLKKLLTHICNNYTLVLSSYIIEELEEVINRKFPTKKQAMENFLFNLPYELEYTPSTILENINIRDKKDIPVLYSAIISDVDVLVTGDKDFDDISIEKPKIMDATEFLNTY